MYSSQWELFTTLQQVVKFKREFAIIKNLWENATCWFNQSSRRKKGKRKNITKILSFRYMLGNGRDESCSKCETAVLRFLESVFN